MLNLSKLDNVNLEILLVTTWIYFSQISAEQTLDTKDIEDVEYSRQALSIAIFLGAI